MKCICTCLRLAICLAVLSAGPAFTQTTEDEVTTKATAPVAYVYAQTTNGINVYGATAAGKLTLVNGSPFQPSGPGQTMVGSNGKYLIMLGANDLHSYPVASNGAIREQVSQVDTQDYGGWPCGAPKTSELSNSGQMCMYFWRGNDCDAVQTYSISKAGDFVFIGDTEFRKVKIFGHLCPP